MARTNLQSPEPLVERSIAGVMDAMAVEARDLHQSAERLQWMAGTLLEKASIAADDPLILEAQALDALSQKLDALSGFLARLSEGAPPEWRLDIADALSAVPLADLAKRLCRDQAAEVEAYAPSGDCELF